MTTPTPLTRDELAEIFPGPVIVTPLTAADVAANLDTERAFLLRDEGSNEMLIVEPLYSDKDRERFNRMLKRTQS